MGSTISKRRRGKDLVDLPSDEGGNTLVVNDPNSNNDVTGM